MGVNASEAPASSWLPDGALLPHAVSERPTSVTARACWSIGEFSGLIGTEVCAMLGRSGDGEKPMEATHHLVCAGDFCFDVGRGPANMYVSSIYAQSMLWKS